MKSLNIQIMISIALSALIIWSAIWFVSDKSGADIGPADEPPVSFSDGRQIIAIFAKGGYSPRIVEAKAGVPTVLRIKTDGTFDCSASLVIPALSYRNFLPSSGIVEIAIPADLAGSEMRGFCSMGMYGFRINFKRLL